MADKLLITQVIRNLFKKKKKDIRLDRHSDKYFCPNCLHGYHECEYLDCECPHIFYNCVVDGCDPAINEECEYIEGVVR